MIRSIFLTVIIALSTLYAAAAKETFIPIETKNSSMILSAKDGEVLFHHYGGKISNPESFSGYQSYRRADYGTDPLAYPATGGRYFNEAALTVEYADSDWNTELSYVSHEQENIQTNVTRTKIHMSDNVKDLNVTLVYDANWDSDVIVCHSEISNNGKKDITLRNFYSSSLPLKSKKYLLTHFHGSWAREMQVTREVLTNGIKTIESKKGVRTTHTENPSFVLSLDTDSWNENYGEVIAGALAWSGNYKISFQIDETDKLNILAGINPHASAYTLKKAKTFVNSTCLYLRTTSTC